MFINQIICIRIQDFKTYINDVHDERSLACVYKMYLHPWNSLRNGGKINSLHTVNWGETSRQFYGDSMDSTFLYQIHFNKNIIMQYVWVYFIFLKYIFNCDKFHSPPSIVFLNFVFFDLRKNVLAHNYCDVRKLRMYTRHIETFGLSWK